MLQNIFAELFGMAITLFIVDRWIKSREEKRWRPAKNFLYSKLFTLANDFLVHFIPAQYWKIDPVAYCFGETEVMVGIEVNNKLLPELVENDFGMSENISETGFTDIETIEKMRDDIKDIFSNSIELIEPELLSKLFDLENALVFFLKVAEMSETDNNVKITADMLVKLMATTSLIRLWLLSKVTRKIGLEKFIDEQSVAIKDIQGQKSKLIARERNRKTKTG